MTRGRLVWANLMRHKWRTILTMLSVAVAMFLFASLRSFDGSTESRPTIAALTLQLL